MLQIFTNRGCFGSNLTHIHSLRSSEDQFKDNGGFTESLTCRNVQAMFMCISYGTVFAEIIEDLDAVINIVHIRTFSHIWRGSHIGNLEKIAKQNSIFLLWFTKGVDRAQNYKGS